MGFSKVPQENADAFHAALPDDTRVERRTMFGCPCAFARGHMFCGTHQDDIVIRLPEAGRAELLAVPGSRPFVPMPGRPMREYVCVPVDRVRDVPFLGEWIARALEYAGTLPDKPKKPARKAARPAKARRPQA